MQATNQIFRSNRPLHQQSDPELFIFWKFNQNLYNFNWNQYYIETKPNPLKEHRLHCILFTLYLHLH